jgi:hypothetical protein
MPPAGKGSSACASHGVNKPQESAFVLGFTAQKSVHTGTANNQNTVSK